MVLEVREVNAPTVFREPATPGHRDNWEGERATVTPGLNSDIRVNESDQKHQMFNSFHFGTLNLVKVTLWLLSHPLAEGPCYVFFF